MNDKPIAIDAYCGQGGATRGLQDAGYYVIGIDLYPQPRYIGDEFIQADAITWIRDNLNWLRDNKVLGYSGPPCQGYSACQRIMRNDHPYLIAGTRDAFEDVGVPYVIENVGGARTKLRNPVELCGSMFGLQTYRHRYFEAGGGLVLPQPMHPRHLAPQTKMGRPVQPGEYGQFIGNFSGVGHARQVMETPWMNRDGIREAVPPAYTRWIGEHALTTAAPVEVPA